MWALFCIFSAINFMTFTTVVVKDVLKEKCINSALLFKVIYILTFGIIPFLISFLFVIDDRTFRLRNVIVLRYDDNEAISLCFMAVMAFICFFVFNYSYNKGNKARVVNKKEFLSEKQLVILGIICMTIGIASLFIWTDVFGGPIRFIEYAAAVRGDSDNTWANNQFAMFKHPARLIYPALFLFYTLIANKNSRYKIIEIPLFLINLIFAIILLLDNDGRLTIVSFALIMVLFPIIKKEIVGMEGFVFLAIAGLICAIVITQLDSITSYIRSGEFSEEESTPIFTTLVNEFLYVYKSNINASEHNAFTIKHLFWLEDLITGIQAWLPTSLKFYSTDSVWQYNTKYSGSKATVPCDIISEGIYDFGIIGPIIFVYIAGKLLAFADKRLLKSKTNYNMVYFMGILMMAIRLPNYCSLYDIMLNIFPYIVFALISIIIKIFSHEGVLISIRQRSFMKDGE